MESSKKHDPGSERQVSRSQADWYLVFDKYVLIQGLAVSVANRRLAAADPDGMNSRDETKTAINVDRLAGLL